MRAFAEVSAATGLLCSRPWPDIGALVLLRFTQEHIADRNEWLPVSLPALRAGLGESERAEELARSILRPDKYAAALGKLAGSLATVGEYGRARELAVSAEDAAEGVNLGYTEDRLDFWRELAHTWGVVGCREHAARVVQHIQIPEGARKTDSLGHVARAYAAAGLSGRARELVASTERTAEKEAPFRRWRTLLEAAEAWLALGDEERTRAAVCAVAASPHPLPSFARGESLSRLAKIWHALGEPERAVEAATAADASVQERRPDRAGAQTLVEVAGAWLVLGNISRASTLASAAEEAARAPCRPFLLVDEWGKVVGGLAAAGDHERARALAAVIEATVQDGGSPPPSLQAAVAAMWAAVGEQTRAKEAMQAALASASGNTNALAEVSARSADAGLHGQAREAAMAAEAAVRHLTDAQELAEELPDATRALVSAGLHDRATRLIYAAEPGIHGIELVEEYGPAMVSLIQAWHATGRHDRTRATAEDVLEMCGDSLDDLPGMLATQAGPLIAAGLTELAEECTDDDPLLRDKVLLDLVLERAAVRDYERATEHADDVKDPHKRVRAMALLASTMAECGDRDRAMTVAEMAKYMARSLPGQPPAAMAHVVVAWAAVGDHDRAASCADALDATSRGAALGTVLSPFAAADSSASADRLLDADPAARYRLLSLAATSSAWPLAALATTRLDAAPLQRACDVLLGRVVLSLHPDALRAYPSG
ncbi:hypothetical protein [Streptomyces sp. NPDC096095]|uniref:hypothetical protein n=1 Tax=Streptomyces sp. NPDC096095 TaxID=3155545 RepID=UPI0033295DA7